MSMASAHAAVMPANAAMEEQPQALPPPAQWTTNMTASSLTTVEVGNSCLDEQIERLKRCEYLREGEVKALCLRAREILVDESNVQRVDAPVTVGFTLFVGELLQWLQWLRWLVESHRRLSSRRSSDPFSPCHATCPFYSFYVSHTCLPCPTLPCLPRTPRCSRLL